jgi:SPP1 gp7 family putative phage head morphogenesis protein
MSKPNKTYWIDRQEQQFIAGEKLIADYYTDLQKAFRQAQKEINKVIESYYVRYADANGFSFAAAQKALNRAEIGELNDFIDLVRANMGSYNLEVTNMSIKARITRYQALQKQIDALLQQLYAVDYEVNGAKMLKEVYSRSYYQTWFNIDQYKGFHQAFALVDSKAVEELITYPFNGADYSDRLWKQKDHMLQQLNEGITTMLVQGKNPNTFSQDFAKKFERKQYEANRLLYTEGSFMIEQGTLAAYLEDGVGQYELIATLDLKTSEICMEIDGKRFDIAEAVTGVNYPPFHPWCRTTTIPYYDDTDSSGSTRAARDPITGKTYKVPADMTYKEWKAEYIESNPDAVLAAKKYQNAITDKTQFEKYQILLGGDAPKSLAVFQEIKYNNSDEYGVLKAQVKGMGYYNLALSKEPAITQIVTETASATGMKQVGLQYLLKARDSFLRKIRSNYDPGGNQYEIKDILRYTYTASAQDLADKTLKSIEALKKKGYNTIEIKNTWTNKNNPYKGINTTVISPDGQKFELQYHTPESFTLKDGKLHELYEKQRLLTDVTSEEYLKLQQEMFELSDSLVKPKDIEKVKK